MKTCITALFAATLWIAASPAAPVPKHLMPKPKFDFPTEVGTRWVYEIDSTESVQEIVETKQVEGGTVIVVESQGSKSRIDYLVSPDGFAQLGSRPVVLGEPFWNLRTGDTSEWRWTSRFVIPNVIQAEGTFKAIGVEKIKVPAGTFEAIRVQMNITLPTNDEITTWFASGLGKVRVEDKGRVEVLKNFTRGSGKPKRPVGMGR